MNNKEFILHGIQSVVDHTLPQHHVFGDLFTTAQQLIQKRRGLKLWKSEPIWWEGLHVAIEHFQDDLILLPKFAMPEQQHQFQLFLQINQS